METSNKIKVKVFDRDGITNYDDIRLVRISSEDYSLLIMDEHTAVAGEIVGTITINSNEIDVEYKDITGYYVDNGNVFNLFIKEK